jgi:hypothetical protein
MRKSKCIRVFEPDTVTDKRSLREIFSEFGGVDTVETIEAPLPNAKSLFAFIHYKRLGDVKMAKQMMDKRANEPKIIIGVFLFAMETNKVLPSQTSSENFKPKNWAHHSGIAILASYTLAHQQCGDNKNARQSNARAGPQSRVSTGTQDNARCQTKRLCKENKKTETAYRGLQN